MDKQSEIKRGRGRPPLSPQEKEERRIAKNKKTQEYHKSTGYAARKKYDEAHPERSLERSRRRRSEYSDITVAILKKHRHLIDEIASASRSTLSAIFVKAVEEKYQIKLTED